MPKSSAESRILAISARKASLGEAQCSKTRVTMLASPSLMPGMGTSGGMALSTA